MRRRDDAGGCQAEPSRWRNCSGVMGRGGNWPEITAAAKASPVGACTGAGDAWATSSCVVNELLRLEEVLDASDKPAGTACVSASLDATVETIGDGAILATMIQSDTADYFGRRTVAAIPCGSPSIGAAT